MVQFENLVKNIQHVLFLYQQKQNKNELFYIKLKVRRESKEPSQTAAVRPETLNDFVKKFNTHTS